MTDTRQAAIDALVLEINHANNALKGAKENERDPVVFDREVQKALAQYRLTAAARALAVLTSPQGL